MTKMLIINFLQTVASMPLLPVCGIPLACRTSHSGLKSGFNEVLLLVHPADLAPTNELLKEDKRLGAAKAVATFDGLQQELRQRAEGGPIEICIAAGNHIWAGDMLTALRGARLPDEHNTWRFGEKNSGMQKAGRNCDPQKIAETLFAAAAGDSRPDTTPARTMPEQPPALSWCEINGLHDVPVAEQLLLSQLVKKADGIVSRHINRKISLAITGKIVHTSITPNQVTIVVLLIGILSGPAIVTLGGYPGLVIGSLLYYLAAILDGCDGELARLKFQGSASGAWLDTVVDDTVGLSFLLGLYSQLYTQESAWGAIGLAAIFFYLGTLLPRYYVMAVFLGSGDYQKLAATKAKKAADTRLARFISLLENTVCRTDFIPFAAFVTALADCSQVFAGAFLIGSIGSAIDSVVTFRTMRKEGNTDRQSELQQRSDCQKNK